MPTVLSINGPEFSGRTTLMSLFYQELHHCAQPDASFLFIDASLDGNFTETYAAYPKPEQTVAGLLQQCQENPQQSNETIDWATSNLLLSIGEGIDLLRTGDLTALTESAPGIQKMLRYGLSRLAKTYQLVIVEEGSPELIALLNPSTVQTIFTLRQAATAAEFLHTACGNSTESDTRFILINGVGSEEEHLALQTLLEPYLVSDELKLIGKLPQVDRAHLDNPALRDLFHNSLLKMNLPLIHQY